MKAYIMLIMLLQMDPDNGLPYTTAMQQSPVIEYSTLAECDAASAQKRTAMLKSSLSYPDLMIVDILIQCVDSSEADFDTDNIVI